MDLNNFLFCINNINNLKFYGESRNIIQHVNMHQNTFLIILNLIKKIKALLMIQYFFCPYDIFSLNLPITLPAGYMFIQTICFRPSDVYPIPNAELDFHNNAVACPVELINVDLL